MVAKLQGSYKTHYKVDDIVSPVTRSHCVFRYVTCQNVTLFLAWSRLQAGQVDNDDSWLIYFIERTHNAWKMMEYLLNRRPKNRRLEIFYMDFYWIGLDHLPNGWIIWILSSICCRLSRAKSEGWTCVDILILCCLGYDLILSVLLFYLNLRWADEESIEIFHMLKSRNTIK